MLFIWKWNVNKKRKVLENPNIDDTGKLDFKEWLNKEQLGNSEPFPVTNLSVYLINSEQIGISEQFWDEQKVPYCQVWLYVIITKQIKN